MIQVSDSVSATAIQPVINMTTLKRLPFRLGESLLLVFELNIAAAGLLMLSSALGLTRGWLYRPAEALAGMLPAALTVGFAAWLVHRLRCVSQARDRSWGLVAAVCLGVVAISFGSGVGKLAMVCLTDTHYLAVRNVIHDPLMKQASLTGFMAFSLIGMVFAITFVLRAGRATWRAEQTREILHERLNRLGESVVDNWSQQIVPRIDALLERDATEEAIRLYQAEFECSRDEASDVIADWPEQRLRLEIEVLSQNLQTGAEDEPQDDVPLEDPNLTLAESTLQPSTESY